MAYDPQSPKAHYDTSIRVPPEVIDEIRQLGMEGAIQKARSGTASPEFIEGVSRFYPNDFQGAPEQETQMPEIPRGVERSGNPTPVATSPSAAPTSLTAPSSDAVQRALSEGPTNTPRRAGPLASVGNSSSARPLVGDEDYERKPILEGLLEWVRSQGGSGGGQPARALPGDEDYERKPFGPAIRSGARSIGDALTPDNAPTQSYQAQRQERLRQERNRR